MRATFAECEISIVWFSCAREFSNAIMGVLVGKFLYLGDELASIKSLPQATSMDMFVRRYCSAISAISMSGCGSPSQKQSSLCQTGQRTRGQIGTSSGWGYSVTGDMATILVARHLHRGIIHVLSQYVSFSMVTQLTPDKSPPGYVSFPGNTDHGMGKRA